MNRFAPLLKKTNDKLNLPQPTKSKIVLEIAADLDDLFHFYLKKGLSEDEAIQKAQEKFAVSDEALSQLIRIHESAFRKFLNKLSAQAQTWWERAALVVALMFIAVLSTRQIAGAQFFLQASIFIWPILGIAFLAIILSLVKFYNLYIKRDHNIKKLRAGLTFILFLGGLNLFLGVCGYFAEMYSAGSYTILPGGGFIAIVCNVFDSDDMLVHITDPFIRSSSVGMISMLVTIFLALSWFLLMNKVLKIEQAESAFLLVE